jgi:hypothetical protein
MIRRTAALLLLVSACTQQGDETFLFRPKNTRQSVTGAAPVVVRERWLAYLADELTTGAGGSDFNGDGDQVDQVAVIVNMVSDRQVRLDVAAQELALIGKHLYLVTDEVLDGQDWNGDADMLDLVLLHTPAENALPSTVEYVADLARTSSGPRILRTDNDRLFYTEDPSADPLMGAETSLSMIRLVTGVPQPPVRLLNDDNLTTLQPLLMAVREDVVVALIDETVEGSDHNGDGDATDAFVLALVDSTLTTPTVKNVALAVPGATAPVDALDISGGETVVAFLVDEAAQGATSLNQYAGAFTNWRPAHCAGDDTDAADDVLHFLWLDTWLAGTTTPRNTAFAGAARVLLTRQGTQTFVATIVPEADDQNCSGDGGLNDDGDATDRVLRWIKVETVLGSSGVFSAASGLVALDDTPGGTRGAADHAGRWIVVIDEAADDRDWDTLAADHDVVAWLDPLDGNAATWTSDHSSQANTQPAGASWLNELEGDVRIAVGFQEEVLGLPINARDNDLLDSIPVFARFDPADDLDFPGPAIAIDADNAGVTLAGAAALFRVEEAADNFDWNDDGDKNDRVLFRTDLATSGQTFLVSTLNNLTRPAVVTDVADVGAAFLADEAAAEADLNQDGDQNDFVVRYMRVGP